MSFENVYRSREGTREINKIADFTGQLVIKNEYEAKLYETTESVGEYYKYYGAYVKNDSFDDYTIQDRSEHHHIIKTALMKRNYQAEAIDLLARKTSEFLKSNMNVPLVRDYLTSLRAVRISYYNEKNFYYRQFMGIPNRSEDFIYVKNHDSDNPEDTIPIHYVTEKDYPQTYTYFFLQDNIQTIIDTYPNLNYLRFINSKFTPYYLRNLQNYAIIRYPQGILSTTELSYFMKSYNKARTQVVLDYIDGFDSKQPLYNVLMIQNLLYYTIINYSNSYIEKYTLGDYTTENVDNILKSYGYSNLTNIKDSDLKKRIIKNINDLIANKSNNYVLELILNHILEVEGNELKRYYIEKQYQVDKDLTIAIDTGKSLENSVKLILRETNVMGGDGLGNSEDTYKDYDSFVDDDNLWGGINETDSRSTIDEKKEKLKKQILKLNFNSILTRYITLTRTVDILEAQRNLRDSLFLMLKYFEMNENKDFYSKMTSFESFECSPAAMFAACCWLQQMKFYDNPDKIIKNQMLINSTAAFRNFGRSITDENAFERSFIRNGKVQYTFDITPEILEWNVADFLKDDDEIETVRLGSVLKYDIVPADNLKHIEIEKEDIGDYVVKYRFYENGVQLGDLNSSTTFGDLISDYRNQYPSLIRRITKKLRDSYDFNEYQAWMFLLNQSRKDNSILGIFKGEDTFSSYITNVCESSELVTWIKSETIDRNTGKPDFDKICNTMAKVTEYFKNWVKTSFSTLVYEYELESDTDNYVSDMVILFNEFLSTYSELYDVNYKYSFGNASEGDNFQLFYNPLYCHYRDKFDDDMILSYLEHSRYYNRVEDDIKLDYSYTYSTHDQFYGSINNDLIIDPKTKEYSTIPLVYENSMKFSDKLLDSMHLDYDLFTTLRSNYEDSVGMCDILEIKVS